MNGLRQIPRGGFDKGLVVARKSAIIQAQFITANFQAFKEIDMKSRPQGWKEKKFRQIVNKLNSKIQPEEGDYTFIDELYEAVISKVYGVPGYKKEFYKGHRR